MINFKKMDDKDFVFINKNLSEKDDKEFSNFPLSLFKPMQPLKSVSLQLRVLFHEPVSFEL
ncbi:MAG: hypothetical protein K9I82_08905 [Chitinophagaceae bacterium]|nr:hypothetical protein [Chitinophagaceae bacterium]